MARAKRPEARDQGGASDGPEWAQPEGPIKGVATGPRRMSRAPGSVTGPWLAEHLGLPEPAAVP